MRYLALVTDYDGVIAENDHPSHEALAAIQRLRASGRRAILITGRRLDELCRVFPDVGLFDLIVAENGAVIFEPSTCTETILAKPPPSRFVERLQELQVEPLEVGRVIVATWLPHHTAVVQAIQELGLELHVIFNRAAVMVLPAGINKGTGMDYALRKLGLSRHEVVGVGDSENDHSFLERREFSATVANAVPSVLQSVHLVARGTNGSGLAELIDDLIANDLRQHEEQLGRDRVAIAVRDDGSEVTVPLYGLNILVAGPSGCGKSTIAAGLAERLIRLGYQLCLVDPEGDYGALPNVITIGNQNHAVTVGEVLSLLEHPQVNLNVNLLGIPLADRPEFFSQLLSSLDAIRIRTGRPHWIVLDEAHQMLPADSVPPDVHPFALGETVLVTVHPDQLAAPVLRMIDVVIAVGPVPQSTLRMFATALGRPCEWPTALSDQPGCVVVWFPRRDEPPFSAKIIPTSAERIRHHRKYAEGNMRQHSFFFRGPENRLNIRTQNLALFTQVADGIDDDTWMFHLRRGDYSRWFRDSVKDIDMADEAERIEQRPDLDPCESRRLIRNLVETKYTLPD